MFLVNALTIPILIVVSSMLASVLLASSRTSILLTSSLASVLLASSQTSVLLASSLAFDPTSTGCMKSSSTTTLPTVVVPVMSVVLVLLASLGMGSRDS